MHICYFMKKSEKFIFLIYIIYKQIMSSISPKYWGESLWNVFYAVAFNYPESNASTADRRDAMAFYNSMRSLIPCVECRQHYALTLRKYPITMEVAKDRAALTKWVNTVHNETNQHLGKPAVSLEDVAGKIEPHRITPPPPPPPPAPKVEAAPAAAEAAPAAAEAAKTPTDNVVYHNLLNRGVIKPLDPVAVTVAQNQAVRAVHPKAGGCGCGRR